jgi:hypothetical protein
VDAGAGGNAHYTSNGALLRSVRYRIIRRCQTTTGRRRWNSVLKHVREIIVRSGLLHTRNPRCPPCMDECADTTEPESKSCADCKSSIRRIVHLLRTCRYTVNVSRDPSRSYVCGEVLSHSEYSFPLRRSQYSRARSETFQRCSLQSQRNRNSQQPAGSLYLCSRSG